MLNRELQRLFPVGILSVLGLLFALPGNSQGGYGMDSVAIVNLPYTPRVGMKIADEHVVFFVPQNNRLNFGVVGDNFKGFILKTASRESTDGYINFLSIDNTSLDTVLIFKLFNNKIDSLLYLGGLSVPFTRGNAFYWHTAQLERRSSYYLVAMKSHGKNINMQYTVLPFEQLQSRYQVYDRMVFIFVGMMLLVAIVLVVAFFSFKDFTFILFFGYVLCLIAWMLGHYGYLFPLFYPRVPLLNEIAKPLSSIGACFFYLLVVGRLFRSVLVSRVLLKKLIRFFAAMLVVVALLSVLLLYKTGPFKPLLIGLWQTTLILTFTCICYLLIAFFRAGTSGKLFLVATAIVTCGAIMQVFANSGYVDVYFMNEHGMAVTSILQVGCMTFAVFYNLIRERRQKQEQVFHLQRAQADILRKFVSVQDDEKKRLAADLHDNIGPLLAALKINFRRIVSSAALPKQEVLITKTEAIIDDAIAEIRQIAHDLAPKGLNLNGLISTVSDFLAGVQQLTNKVVDFEHSVQVSLPLETETQLFRIISELVQNAVKHSRCSKIRVQLISATAGVRLEVSDDGIGMGDLQNQESFGLNGLNSRVKFMSGEMHIHSVPGEGTTIVVILPAPPTKQN